MAIEVKWFATLVKRTKSKKPVTVVEWQEGVTPLAVFVAEGFREVDAESVMVVINDEQAELHTALKDGDRLEFMVSIQGGCGEMNHDGVAATSRDETVRPVSPHPQTPSPAAPGEGAFQLSEVPPTGDAGHVR